jgi:hypothetical protein
MRDLVEHATGDRIRPGRRFPSVNQPVSIIRLDGGLPGILFG